MGLADRSKGFTPYNPKVIQSSSDLQLFIGKNVFLEKKANFFGNKTVDQHSGANLKNVFFAKFSCKFLAFLSFLAQKTLKMTISTSIWSAQHPNAD